MRDGSSTYSRLLNVEQDVMRVAEYILFTLLLPISKFAIPHVEV